jgi:hypothetical protein
MVEIKNPLRLLYIYEKLIRDFDNKDAIKKLKQHRNEMLKDYAKSFIPMQFKF